MLETLPCLTHLFNNKTSTPLNVKSAARIMIRFDGEIVERRRSETHTWDGCSWNPWVLYPAVIHPTTNRKNWRLASFCLPKFLSYHLEPQTTIYKWLFQLDDSKSWYRKWLFHQTSIYKWLFGVPGMDGCFFWGGLDFTFFSAFAKGGVG